MNLTAPRLFQCDSKGILDLSWLNPPYPGNQGDEGDPVVVTVLLPDLTGDPLKVWFGSESKVFQIANPKLAVIDCTFKRSELPPPGNSYAVHYEYKGRESPPVTVELLDSLAAFSPRRVCSAKGVYPPGSKERPSLIDAWAVPYFRWLRRNDPLIVPILDNLPGDVNLEIIRQPFGGGGGEIGAIAYDFDSDQWSVTLDQDCLTLQRSDLIVIQSTVQTQQTLGFAVLL